MGRIEEAPHTEAAPVVEASASLVSPRSALPQEEKLKLVHKLLTVSSQIIRVLVYLLDRVVDTDLFVFILLASGVRAGEQPARGRLRANRSERAGEEALVREGCPSRKDKKTLQGQKRLVYSIYDVID